MADAPSRMNYEESCKCLQEMKWLDAGETPPLPPRQPRYDDEEPLGLNFFRTRVSDDDMSNMTLSRTFFGRSDVRNMRFCNTDLSESTFCWNDFTEVDFTDAVLTACDLRAAIFENVKFVRANLRNADLRLCTFISCDFAGADLRGAKLTKRGAKQLRLSEEQLAQIDWQSNEGPDPGGG